jgi:predicted RNA-binding protein with RPS1 domain
MTETLTNVEAPNGVRALLENWAENPPPSLSAALAENGQSAEALEEYARSGISTEEVEVLRKVLVQGAASADPDDAALLARLTPQLDPRERAWDRMMRAKSTGETLSATVTEAVKGGVVVDVGVRGFVPASQLGLSVPRNLNQYLGRTLKLRVLEVDRRRQTVILSNRVVQEEERADKRRSAIGRVSEGDEIVGTVRRLTDIGAFVDVGGVDGLLHVSELSWKRIDKPSDLLNVGEKVRVKVLKVDPEAGRISLSMRRLAPDPWDAARRKYGVGNTVKVKITALVAQGAVVQLDEQMEGFIPISELAPRRINTPDEVVQVGQEVEAVVIDFIPRERRIVLSIRKLEQRKERQVIDTYQKKVRTTSERTTLGDLFGHLFEEYQPPAPEPAAEAEPEAVAAGDSEEAAVVATPDAEASEAPEVTEVSAEAGIDEAAEEPAASEEAATEESAPAEAEETQLSSHAEEMLERAAAEIAEDTAEQQGVPVPEDADPATPDTDSADAEPAKDADEA